MFGDIKITMGVQRVINEAERVLEFTLGSKIDSTHLLYGLSASKGSVSSNILNNYGITPNRIWSYLNTNSTPQIFFGMGRVEFSNGSLAIIKNAGYVARQTGSDVIGTEHLLFALVSQRDCNAVKLIEGYFHVSSEDIKENLFQFFKEVVGDTSSPTVGNDNQVVDKANGVNSSLPEALVDLGVDMTEQARQGKIDTIIGRDAEIERAVEILCRKTKNNPILIGEAGVGKSAIAEGLALRIAKGDVPDDLKGKTVFNLQIGSLMAGTKYRGTMEEKLKNAIDAIVSSKNIIVFIDEIHTLVQAGGDKGEVSPADMLKPYLARGEMQTIGATTTDEYRKFIEKDKALERRFQPIMVEPPSVQDTIKILQGIKEGFEKYHKVTISDEAIKCAVSLSDRYITDRNLPDKAIDLIDEASSRAKVRSRDGNAVITDEDISSIVSKWTGIPVSKIGETEAEKLKNLENILHKRVIGQDEAVTEVSKALRRARIGLQDKNRPIGSFLFVGKTGVGKTELCKALAEAMFDSENAMIRLDMSEYMESHSVAKLIGAPPGYIGHDDGGQLTEQVRKRPFSVILFDEVEKAHPDVMNILLQLLDDGRLTDSKGRVVNFKNTIIILTSNLGVSELGRKRELGFNASENTEVDEYERTKEILLDAVKRHFRPEFINRLDSIIVFHSLNKSQLASIAKIMIQNVNKRLQDRGITLKFTESALKHIVDNGTDLEYGARPLKRLIQREIEDNLADKLLNGEIHNGDTITVREEKGKLVFNN